MAITREEIVAALRTLCRKIDADKTPWVIFGSANLFLRNVDVSVGDIDILIRAEDAKKVHALLCDYATAPPQQMSEVEKYRSARNIFNIGGVEVDFCGDFQYKLPDGSWSKVKELSDYEILDIDGMKLRALPLAEEVKEYRAAGAAGKVEVIERHLAINP